MALSGNGANLDLIDLISNYKRSQKLYEDREDLLRKKIEFLERKNVELLKVCKENEKSVKLEVKLDEDRMKAEFDRILRIKDHEMEELKESISQHEKENLILLKALNELRVEKDSIEADFARVLSRIDLEFVSANEFDALKIEFDDYKESTFVTMVPKIKYEAAAEKIDELQRKIEDSMISKENYQIEISKRESLQHKMENEMVYRSEYDAIVTQLNDVKSQCFNQNNDIKDLLVSSDGLSKRLLECEAENSVLREKLEVVEDNLRLSQDQQKEADDLIISLKNEINQLSREKMDWRNSIEALENNKALLLTQIGNLKLQLRRENEQSKSSKIDIQQRLSSSNDEIRNLENLKEQLNQQLMVLSEKNENLHKLNNQMEEHFLATIQEMKEEIKKHESSRIIFENQISIKESEIDRLKKTVVDLEKSVDDLSQEKLQNLSSINEISRENLSLKQTTWDVSMKAKYLEDQMKALHEAVLSPIAMSTQQSTSDHQIQSLDIGSLEKSLEREVDLAVEIGNFGMNLPESGDNIQTPFRNSMRQGPLNDSTSFANNSLRLIKMNSRSASRNNSPSQLNSVEGSDHLHSVSTFLPTTMSMENGIEI